MGILQEDAVFDEGEEALYAPVKFTERGMRIVSELKDDIGMSINANGDRSEEGIVESIVPSKNNAVDLVPRAGAGGAIEDLIESFKDNPNKYARLVEVTAPDKAGTDERKKMTEEEITALAESLVESLEPLFTGLAESLAPVVEEEDGDVDAPDLVAATEAATAAGLPAAQRESVRADVAAGVALEEAIKKQKDLRDAILAEASNAIGGGRLLENGGKPIDLSIEWK